ncbi:hypothetical protein BDV09DRAFT_188502 [Aspergillus tetrazonus]
MPRPSIPPPISAMSQPAAGLPTMIAPFGAAHKKQSACSSTYDHFIQSPLDALVRAKTRPLALYLSHPATASDVIPGSYVGIPVPNLQAGDNLNGGVQAAEACRPQACIGETLETYLSAPYGSALAKCPESYCPRPSPAPNSQDSVVAHHHECRLSNRWSGEYAVKVPRQLRSRWTMPSQPQPLLAQWMWQRDFSHHRLNAGVGLTPRAKDVAFDANVETSRG